MMKYILALFLLFFNIHSASAAVDSQEARAWAENKGNEILQILSSQDLSYKHRALDQIMEQDIDLDHAARFVVGKYWRQMSDEQKHQYVPLFKRYLSASYKSFPLKIEENSIHFKIDKVLQSAAGTDVFCTILIDKVEQHVDDQSKGGIKVIFTLVKNNGKVQVRDLKIEESSLLLSLRERFYKMIHVDSDDELDWFMEDFSTLVADMEEKNEQDAYNDSHKM